MWDWSGPLNLGSLHFPGGTEGKACEISLQTVHHGLTVYTAPVSKYDTTLC